MRGVWQAKTLFASRRTSLLSATSKNSLVLQYGTVHGARVEGGSQEPDHLGLHPETKQVVVTELFPGYPAMECGRIFVGDVIISVNGVRVTTVDMALAYRERILAATPEGANFEPMMTLYMTDR